MATALDSISVQVEDMEKTAAFLTDVMGWQRHPGRFTAGGGSASGTKEAVFVDGNGCWLQLVPGSPENGLVDKIENGKYLKLNFVDNPYQELRKRDQGWDHHETDPNIPRIDRVAIIVKDIEKSTGFYTDVLGLKLHPMKFGVDPDANKDIGGFKPAFIFANSIWLVLIQPVGAGPLRDTLEEKGDGHILEVITEVDDLEVFYDRMKSKGIGLVCLDGVTQLTDDMKSQLLEPHGDKLAYIPTDVSQGMVIEVFQRGPRSSSLIHQRDATF